MDRTGQFSAAMYDDERARTEWYSIALLADRLDPTPRMIPTDGTDRVILVGLTNELLGEMGLAWCARLIFMHERAAEAPNNPMIADFFSKYDSGRRALDDAPQRISDATGSLLAQLRSNAANGPFLIGASLSALDIYWAVVSVLVAPDERFGLSEQALMVAAAFQRAVGPVDAELIAHRDRIFDDHYELPLRLD